MKSNILNKRDLTAYFIVAAIGASLQIIIVSLSQEWFQLSYTRAIMLGYTVSFFVGFVLTKLFAFNAKNSAKTRREMVKFTMVSVISGLITVYGASGFYYLSTLRGSVYTFTIPFSVKVVNLNKLVAHTSGMGLSFISNYLLHKTFTFKNTGFYEKLKWLLGL